MKSKVLVAISNKIETTYLKSLKSVISKANATLKGKIKFDYNASNFEKEDIANIERSPDTFLSQKLASFNLDYSTVIYIPDIAINLKDNYIWYAYGGFSNVMLMSSYIYEKLVKEDLDFGAYVLLIYSQFLGRYAINLKESHRVSLYCINDHCGHQREILNVFSNKNIFCDFCLEKIIDGDRVSLIRALLNLARSGYKEKERDSSNISYKHKKTVPIIKDEIKLNITNGYSYEFECYMAKKCANLSELYLKLNSVLCDPSFEIGGYSLYEVDGGWRSEIMSGAVNQEDILQLRELNKKFTRAGHKDLLRPITERPPFCAAYDEASIVLRIIFNSPERIISFDPSVCKVTREISEIFKDITRVEESIFFTVKELHKMGSIERSGIK